MPFEEYLNTPLPACVMDVVEDEVWEEFCMGHPPGMPDERWRDVMTWPEFIKRTS